MSRALSLVRYIPAIPISARPIITSFATESPGLTNNFLSLAISNSITLIKCISSVYPKLGSCGSIISIEKLFLLANNSIIRISIPSHTTRGFPPSRSAFILNNRNIET